MASSSPTVVLLLLLPLLSLAKLVRAQGNVSPDSSLTAGDSNSWRSPSEDFAFGFRKTENEGFLLAIWFDKIPEKTVIWWANGGKLSPQGSKVELTEKGLVLSDPSRINIWEVTMGRVSGASMLDTGNFVVRDGASSILWETFSQPTDTIVPTQVLDRDGVIVSRYSTTSYLDGRFALMMQGDGNLVLYNPPVADPTNAYWASQTTPTGYQLIFNQTGLIYLTGLSGNVLRTITNSTLSSGDFYHRAVLEHDGVFRQYVYPRNGGSGWSTNQSSSVPLDICTSVRRTIGGGVCGWNSYCILGDDHRPKCNCPPSFSYIDPLNEMKGCKPEFVPQSCEEGITVKLV